MSENDQDMRSTVRRRTVILEKLEQDNQVNVSDLSAELGVSEVTIRNDLAQLELKNLLIRARGGAIKVSRVGMDHRLSEKNKVNIKEKRKIGKAAARLISDNDTIIIDSGSTTSELVHHMEGVSNLNVITNALTIASQLSNLQNINVIVPGGFLRRESLSLVGAPAENTFQNYYCDKLFLGADGIDIEHGLSTPNIEEAHLNQKMVSISKQVILLADSSKFSKRSLAFICGIDQIDVLVTDSGIDKEFKNHLERIGINVIVA